MKGERGGKFDVQCGSAIRQKEKNGFSWAVLFNLKRTKFHRGLKGFQGRKIYQGEG